MTADAAAPIGPRGRGALFGYPGCCIAAFIGDIDSGRLPAARQIDEAKATGFVPCSQCAARIAAIGLSAFVAQEIAPRRSPALRPFPDDRPVAGPEPVPDSDADPNRCRIPTLHAARAELEPPGIWRHDPEALRAFLERCGLSVAKAAGLLGMTPRGFRQWMQPDPKARGARRMPYHAWAALTLLAARTEIDNA